MQFRRRRFGGKAGDDRWHRRPSLSRALRIAIFLGPIAASLLIATLLSRALPPASGPLTAVLWVGIVVFGSLVTLGIFERAARRLLPLAALLNVSLLFPDKAPARFAVARRTGSPRQLQEQLAEARAAGNQDDAQRMQSVVELVLALSVHDKGTRGHSERVRVFTDLLAEELRIDPAGQARLRWAALLHDVGKIEVPTTLLNKSSTPDEDEWKVLHRHPEDGARMVAPLLPWLGEWGKVVVEHHERYDGTGYPFGLKAHEISLGARIVAVADTYEVMTAPRPYKRAMSIAAARAELTRVAGTQLDPGIVRGLSQHLGGPPLAHDRRWCVDRADPGARPALDGTREIRTLGGRGRADRDHGGGTRSGWAGRTFAECLESVGLAGIPGTYVVTSSVEYCGRGSDDQPIGTGGGAHLASFRRADLIHSTIHGETDDAAHANTEANANSEANGDAHPDAVPKSHSRSVELREVHRYTIVVHQLLHQ